MTTMLPLDTNDHPIPALRLRNGGAHSIATVPVTLRFGGASVTASASDHYFPAGFYYDIAIGAETAGHNTHLAVLAVGTAGTVYVSEKE